MRGYPRHRRLGPEPGSKSPRRFGCRRVENGRFLVPSEFVIRDVLIRVDSVELDRALQRRNEAYAGQDQSLAIDGKTMCNALDEDGRQRHILSVVGHQRQSCYTPKKKLALSP